MTTITTNDEVDPISRISPLSTSRATPGISTNAQDAIPKSHLPTTSKSNSNDRTTHEVQTIAVEEAGENVARIEWRMEAIKAVLSQTETGRWKSLFRPFVSLSKGSSGQSDADSAQARSVLDVLEKGAAYYGDKASKATGFQAKKLAEDTQDSILAEIEVLQSGNPLGHGEPVPTDVVEYLEARKKVLKEELKAARKDLKAASRG